MLSKIFTRYLLVFGTFYIGYSFFNWLLTSRTAIVGIDEALANFWIPFVLAYAITYLIFRPMFRGCAFPDKVSSGLLWVLLPFSLALPVAASQQYFKDASHKVIGLETPADVRRYPHEKFFTVRNYYVKQAHFSWHRKEHITSGRRPQLKVNSYFITPMYSDSVRMNYSVAYALRFDTTINYGLLVRDAAPARAKAFFESTFQRFTERNYYNVSFFEKAFDSDHANELMKAWRRNPYLKLRNEPIILVANSEPFAARLHRGMNLTVYSLLICLAVTLGLLYLFIRKLQKRTQHANEQETSL